MTHAFFKALLFLAEETGLIGALLLLALFLALVLLGLLTSLRVNSHFSRLLAIGLSFNLFLYVVINVAMVTGLIPVVGVPLPLISYGGTAMLTIMVGLGLLLSADLHRYTTIPRFPVDL
ncbi:MAG: FtsW/RodA/SpoVE family cell cycle protein, partial [Pseudomonadota bacterium]